MKKGSHHSPESIAKMIANNVGRRGQITPPEHRRKIAESHKLENRSPEWTTKLKQSLREYWDSPHGQAEKLRCSKRMKKQRKAKEFKEAEKRHSTFMREYFKTHSPPNKGIPMSEEQKRKLRLIHLGLQAGEKHPRWLGGKTLEPYGVGWTQAKKKLIKERDNYTCQKCFTTTGTMDVHHIDYDKKNNKFTNLITLCHLCNARVNLNRDFWQLHFQTIMKTKIQPKKD